jgi:hypothetical protein
MKRKAAFSGEVYTKPREMKTDGQRAKSQYYVPLCHVNKNTKIAYSKVLDSEQGCQPVTGDRSPMGCGLRLQ